MFFFNFYVVSEFITVAIDSLASDHSLLFFRIIFTHKSSYCFQHIVAIAILSICPSVCSSVTRVDQSKMVQARITRFSLSAARKTSSMNHKAFP